ncbi:hypothetical protein [Aquicella siphonis]|uniref:hypothetical protein n=1 Tax=Aquicella siphonis TaxID=254247 RepID=UPI0011DD222B|nr:hypothetical protein [Aquicella siphonis]
MYNLSVPRGADNYTELVYLYFWHDKNNTITGCYEGRIAYFTNLDDIVAQPRVMDSVHWLLAACQNQNLLKK